MKVLLRDPADLPALRERVRLETNAKQRDRLFVRGVQLITRLKGNMKNCLMPLMDKLLLRKRAIIETIIDQLKNISQIEHSRHRSGANYFADIIAGLIA
jgi:hypothetical protein